MFKLRSLRCFVAGARAKTGTNSGEEGEKTTHYGWSPLRMHDVGLNPQLSCLTPSPPPISPTCREPQEILFPSPTDLG